ncbi:endonuclease/exonuclease/phosphatase family protein [Winogradskyella maritima]|uniref:Endonuclease/exonuclease/phosphatase family protein n=1 Tax=Winogradskyella maritima TaxID=1517766 RepID=A0ABV8AIT6_9FLAO|nr:endonuclease/exonuclease/phosphatase family protein [Winogradskyella maritima]
MDSKLRTGLFIFGVIAIILTFMPYISADYWWVRMFDYPHLQLTGLTLLALLLYFIKFDFRFYGDYIFAGFLLFCFVWQLQKIYPYTEFSDYEVLNASSNPKSSLKLYAANVLQKNEDYEKAIKDMLKEDADIMVFTETNTIWQNEIRKALPASYTEKVEYPLDNTYGILMYSKLPLINPEVKFLVSDSVPSIHTKVSLKDGSLIQLYSIHPTPPMPQENPTSTDRDAEMMMIAKKSLDSDLPVIVLGDFNDVAWSQTSRLFQSVSRLSDARIGRGLYNTFNAKNVLMRWPLDHIFISDEFRIKSLSLGEDIGSDHFPMVATLSFEPDGIDEQGLDSPTEAELEQANTIIQNFKED